MRVLIADDHSIIRTALGAVLASIDPVVEVVEATSYADLHARHAQADPASFQGQPFDIVILDLRMPGYDGHDSVAAVVRAVAPCPVAVFSMTEDVEDMRALLALGARAYIPKTTPHAVLSGVLRIVLSGGTYIPPALGLAPVPAGPSASAMALATPPAPAVAMPASGEEAATLGRAMAAMTPRQREVMVLLGQGLSNNEICARLGLNLSTVKAHVSSVLRALHADSRTQAAIRIRGLLP